MSPRWLAIEKLVTELGGVYTARAEIKGRLDHEPPEVEVVLREATRAVTAAMASPVTPAPDASGEDEIVRSAWMAIAVAQDLVARLREEVTRSRGLRDRARDLQYRSLRRRLHNRPGSD